MIQEGSSVQLHYTLKVEGDVVDSSADGEPLEYVQGSGQIIPGLEKQLAVLSPGDKRRLTVPPEEGYGVSFPELVQKVPAAAFKDVPDLKAGAIVRGEGEGGSFQALVAAVSETEVILDLNHPLAGKTLSFDVEIVKVAPPPSKLILP